MVFVASTAFAHSMTTNRIVFVFLEPILLMRIIHCSAVRDFLEVRCGAGKDHVASYHITTTVNMMWKDIPYTNEPMSTREECGKSCLEDCNCDVALFINSYCQRQKLPLRYVRRDTSQNTVAFFKVGIRSWNETIPSPVKPSVYMFTSKKSYSSHPCFNFSFCYILMSCPLNFWPLHVQNSSSKV